MRDVSSCHTQPWLLLPAQVYPDSDLFNLYQTSSMSSDSTKILKNYLFLPYTVFLWRSSNIRIAAELREECFSVLKCVFQEM